MSQIIWEIQVLSFKTIYLFLSVLAWILFKCEYPFSLKVFKLFLNPMSLSGRKTFPSQYQPSKYRPNSFSPLHPLGHYIWGCKEETGGTPQPQLFRLFQFYGFWNRIKNWFFRFRFRLFQFRPQISVNYAHTKPQPQQGTAKIVLTNAQRIRSRCCVHRKYWTLVKTDKQLAKLNTAMSRDLSLYS